MILSVQGCSLLFFFPPIKNQAPAGENEGQNNASGRYILLYSLALQTWEGVQPATGGRGSRKKVDEGRRCRKKADGTIRAVRRQSGGMWFPKSLFKIQLLKQNSCRYECLYQQERVGPWDWVYRIWSKKHGNVDSNLSQSMWRTMLCFINHGRPVPWAHGDSPEDESLITR